jgi:hypothetical protein
MKSRVLPALMLTAALAACSGGSGGSAASGTAPAANMAQQIRVSMKATSNAPAAYATVVQQLYLSYFGRPADTTGLANFEAALAAADAPSDIASLAQAYGSNAAVKSLIDSFGTSAESQALYGSGTTTQFVSAIFQNVLDRAPASGGLDFWVNSIDSGSLTKGDAALSIMAGALSNNSAQGVSDAALVNAKIAVAAQFTASIGNAAEVTAYSGSAAATAARGMMGQVMASTTATSFSSTIASTIAGLVTSAASSNTKGQVNLALTDGPSDNFNHVWVTVSAVSFHTSATEVWSASDATWQTVTLPAPVTIDMAALNNGTLNNLFAGMALPNGTYRQIRLFFAGPDAALTASAQATMDDEATPQPLQWNDQVEYTNSRGTVEEAALEMAYATQGVQLLGTFAVNSGTPLNLAVDFDLDKIIVPFRFNDMTAFTMRGNLAYFDLNQSGAVTGTVDPSALCPSGQPAATCAYNLFVHAELLSSDGARHYAARTTSINPATGQFTLFPLPAVDANGNALTYDVVIRGRNMNTMLVTGLAPVAGSTPASGAIQVQSSLLEPTITADEYAAQFSSALQPLTSGWSIYQQTLPGGVPYEVRWGNTDPLVGTLFSPIKLEVAPLLVAPYNGGAALGFNPVTPVEGLGGYNVATNDVAYYTLSSNTLINAPAVGAVSTTVSFAPPSPTLDASVQNGTISGTITVSGTGSYDHASLVLARFASIVTATDVSAALTGSGSFTLSSIPSGSAAAPVPGAYYYAYLVFYNAGSGKRGLIVPIPNFIDLRTTNSVSNLNISVSD